MSQNNHKNKCRNHQYGGANAHWFNIRVARNRRRTKIATASLKKNRRRK